MSGNIEWEDKRKQRCFVMWRTPDEWAALIFKWVQFCHVLFSGGRGLPCKSDRGGCPAF